MPGSESVEPRRRRHSRKPGRDPTGSHGQTRPPKRYVGKGGLLVEGQCPARFSPDVDAGLERLVLQGEALVPPLA